MKMVQTDYGNNINIIFNQDYFAARPMMISDVDVVANEDGKKIVKAGSPLGVDGKVANDTGTRYILLQDIDVTYGPAVGAGVYRGTLNEDKIRESYGQPISAAAKLALIGILFFTDNNLVY